MVPALVGHGGSTRPRCPARKPLLRFKGCTYNSAGRLPDRAARPERALCCSRRLAPHPGCSRPRRELQDHSAAARAAGRRNDLTRSSAHRWPVFPSGRAALCVSSLSPGSSLARRSRAGAWLTGLIPPRRPRGHAVDGGSTIAVPVLRSSDGMRWQPRKSPPTARATR